MPEADARTLSFAERIIAWQRRAGRHGLPWQGQRDPYRVWLSETMLQQTQVATVLPYYDRFLAAFPSVQALADAPSEQVMAHWAGLGYYSRARNLHRCAQRVAHEMGGRFPRSRAELESLPGIGRSTAAAIAVFAFGKREAILDGNVKRVLCRHDAIEGEPDASATLKRLWALAEQRLPADRLDTYTQGLMDLGATVCMRARPDCARCPLSASCQALAQDRVHALPTRRQRRPTPWRSVGMLVLRRQGPAGAQIWLPARPTRGIWGGLRSLPECPLDASALALAPARADLPWTSWCEALAADLGVTATGLAAHGRAQARALPALDHAFTHFRLRMYPWLLELDPLAPMRVDEPVSAGGHWALLADRETLPLPAPIKRLLAQLEST